MPSVLCLVIDRLHAGFLGAYGNSWVETPEFDRLAAESFVFDHAQADTPDLHRRYESYWQGKSPLAAGAMAAVGDSLAKLAARAGYATTLVSDDPAVFEHPLAADFAQVIPYRFPPRTESAPTPGETNLAEFFAAASEALRSADATEGAGPYLLWLHTQGMAHTWDAPLDFRATYLDEDDEEPPEFVAVPDHTLPKNVDPDERLALRRAYAAQVALFDACLGWFLESLRSMPAERQPVVVLLSSRGFPLGEHGQVGACGTGLHSELVHVPCLLRFPDGEGASARSQSLVLPVDLPATLAEVLGQPPASSDQLPTGAGRSLLPLVRAEAFTLRDRVVLVGEGGERALRTPAWFLHRTPAAADAVVDEFADETRALNLELFAKPDDRWEVNEVADRCREIAEELSQALDDYEQRALAGIPERELTPLDSALAEGL